MPRPNRSQLIDEVWEYPLFEALYGRRSRRFGRGFEMTEGPFQYKSGQTPVPLSEIEEALLVAAGVGFTGIALWDQARPLPQSRFQWSDLSQHLWRPANRIVLHQ